MINLILAIVIFGFLVFVHELGHFLVAKAVGITVEEFSIGFGPPVVSVKKDDTHYSLRLLPFFSYVRMRGAEPGDEGEAEGSFNSKSVLQRFAVVGAGPFMYFLLASLLFAVIFSAIGVGQPTTVVHEVVPGYPAERAGIRAGDRILSIGGTAARDWETIVLTIHANPGKSLPVVVERAGKQVTFEIVPAQNPDDPARGFIGIRPDTTITKMHPLRAIVAGVGQTFSVVALWFRGIVMMITRKVQADVVGPVGIIQMIGEASRLGVASVLALAAAMAANLGMLNLLPFPALDGSRLAFLVVEAIRGKPVDPEKEAMVHLVGLAILLALGVFITYKDIIRIAT